MEKNKIENINLHDLVENQDNPRSIEPQQMQKLVESILTFPKMLQMRPIVCNENRVILGGNMRFRALLNIEQMEDEAIRNTIEAVAVKLTDGEKQQLCSHWEKWKAEPKVEVVMADSLSEEETDEFIIKDNVGFGEWDWDQLANEWDAIELADWGMDIPKVPDFDAGTMDDQGSLDQIAPKFIACPHCGKEFDANAKG